MVDLVIKGEIHTSRGDFEEERDLLAEGIDILVVEGQEGKAEYCWLHSWFGVAMMIFEYLFARFLYTDAQTLVDIAKGQGADVVYTRESDADLLDNSHRLVVIAAFVLFYFFLFVSIIYGAALGNQIGGAASLLMSGLGPVLLLRLHETWKSDENRDELIAEKIENGLENGARVVAIMGQQHAEDVPEHLPDDIDPEVREPQYGVFSLPMLRDLAGPILRLCGTLSIVYPVFLVVPQIWLSFV